MSRGYRRLESILRGFMGSRVSGKGGGHEKTPDRVGGWVGIRLVGVYSILATIT